jgi:ferrochelatase
VSDQFQVAGGEQFAVLACLNDSEPGTGMIEVLVRRELAGWLEGPDPPSQA